MFTVHCPRCRHDMLFQPKGSIVGKKKQCVYCGCTFSVHTNLARTNIVCQGKRTAFNEAW